MNSKIISITIALSLSVASIAQNFDSKSIKSERFIHDYFQIPEFIEFTETDAVDISQLESIYKYYLKGHDSYSYRMIGEEIDQLGMLHQRFIQTYNGLDIEYSEFIVHQKNGTIKSINGKMIKGVIPNSNFDISEADALSYAINDIGAKSYKWQLPFEEKHLKVETNDPNATYFPTAEKVMFNNGFDYLPANYQAAYKFNIYAHEPLSRYEVYVSAENGDVIYKNSLIHTANSKGTAQTAYSGSQTINTDSISPTSFRLRQTVYGNGINTYDLNNGTNYGGAVDFTDSDNIWNNVNPQLDQYATDAHWGAEHTYQYLQDHFGRNSINNAGFTLNSYVHYSSNYANAFWDGQRMTYGDGNGNINPLVALDIAGHEIAHGLTTFSANLIYAGQSGALNESFSDIFGAAIEFDSRPSRANWQIGEDIGTVIRSMSNPNLYGDPDTYEGTNWLNTIGCTPSNQNDNCGVHINSGVQNFWFYLLSTGGSGVNDNGDTYSVSSITIDSAAAVAYRNLTVYLTRSSDYLDARHFAIQSAKDLFGDCSIEVESVTNAWHAVGVGRKYIPNASSDFIANDTSNCQAPFTVSFRDNSVNANTYFWDFGDGNTSTQRSPIHTYQNIGNYDVSLAIDGGLCGTDTLLKSSYVRVDSSIFCEILLNNGANPTQTDCSGKIYDSGGASGSYSANENGTITISPTGAASVTLTFLSFDVEAGQGNTCNYDYLEIFDGSSTSATSLGVFCNNNVPSIITSTGSSITLQFVSDQALEETGFELDWTCNVPTAPPVAAISIDSTNSCLGAIKFEDLSSNAPNSWFWDFGDGNSSTLEDPTHVYNASGTYSVKLVAGNQFGSDSLILSNLVSIQRPIAPIANSDTFCTQQTAVLYANGQAEIRWFDAIGGNQLAAGDSINLGVLSANRTVYAQDYYAAPLQNVGPTNNTIGSGANFNNFQYLIFDVFDDMILERVSVYSGRSGNRAIQLRDGNGNPIETKYVFVGSGLQFIYLDFHIPPGTNYQLGVEQGSTIEFYRNNSGTSYPYNIPGLVSIKRSSAQSNPVGFYYFFYDWKVKELDCSSPMVPVNAFLDNNCSTVGLESHTTNGFNMYPNPANDKVILELSAYFDYEDIIVRDVTGREVPFNLTPISNVKIELNLPELTSGLYYISIRDKQTITTKPLLISKE